MTTRSPTRVLAAAILAGALATAGPGAAAQESPSAMPMHEHMDHEHMDHAGHHPVPAAASKTDSPATKAFRDVEAQMHRDMDIRYANDVDVDFVRGMIPHHTGAIAMARVALDHSKDPEIRKLAEEIIKAQETEIAQMRDFLKRKGS